MERIFGRTWVYLGHDCEISQDGDYKTTTIGTHPVIVARLADGSVTALLNRCRHRGATVCQHEVGNSRFFRCAYHAWTYANDGKLIGVPMPAGYGPSFKREEHGLATVPRIASHRGFIFGSMVPDGPNARRASRRRQEASGRLIAQCRRPARSRYSAAIRNAATTTATGSTNSRTVSIPTTVGALHRSAVSAEAMKIYKEGKGRVIDMDGHGVTDAFRLGRCRSTPG